MALPFRRGFCMSGPPTDAPSPLRAMAPSKDIAE